MSSLFRQTQPVTPVRGVHLDLKGVPPTPERLLRLLDVFAAARYNAVLVEWEDTFPWTCDARLRCETAYTPDEVRAFAAAAAARGIEVISLVQCLGHVETPLSLPGNEHLREVAHRSDVLNPLAAGARELVQAMVDDVLALLPATRHLHLGGDEAWSFGTHPDTAAYVAAHGKGALYLQHVEPILDHLNARGVRPILWHDMMVDWDDAAVARLAGQADLCAWGYQGHPDTTTHHFSSRHIARFAEHGVALWGGTAYKGADGHNVDRPVPDNRRQNALAWSEVAQRYGFKGVFATAWSRYSTHDVQCEPIDAALDCLFDVGVVLHDGQPAEGGLEACVAALAPLGEQERFVAAREAMEALTGVRRWGWTVVQQLRECLVTATVDARRREAGVCTRRLKDLANVVARADAVAAQTRQALAGCVADLWLDRYLAERLDPLREELGALAPRVQLLDPDGYRAELGGA